MNVTVPWLKSELINEQLCYHAEPDETGRLCITHIHLLGGETRVVAYDFDEWLQDIKGAVYRKPKVVREPDRTVEVLAHG